MQTPKQDNARTLQSAARENIETGLLLLSKEALVTAIQDRNLDRLHLRVFAAVLMHMGGSTARAWPSRTTLAAMIGVEPITVSNRLRDLRRLGYLIAERERVPAAGNRSLAVYTIGRVDHETIRSEIKAFVDKIARARTVTADGDNRPPETPSSVTPKVTASSEAHSKVTAGGFRESPPAVHSNSPYGETPPYPPNGGNSANATINEVNDHDRPLVERLLEQGDHLDAIEAFVVQLLAKVRLSASDKDAALSKIAAAASGLTTGQMAKAVDLVVGDGGRDRVKPKCVLDAIREVRRGGEWVAIERGTPAWEAWVEHAKRTSKPNAAGFVLDWWNRYDRWTVPTALPPVLEAAPAIVGAA